MAQDERFKNVDFGEDPDGSFDDFIKAKVKRACQDQPASAMIPTDTATDVAPVVAERLSSESKSNVTSEPSASEFTPVVPDVAEKGTELEVRRHELVGSYITEKVVEYAIDEDWRKQYINAYEETVKNLTLEQALERRRKVERILFLIRGEEQGINLGIEQLCQLTNAKDRERFLEEDRKHRARQAKRVISKERAKTAEASSKRSASPAIKAKGKGYRAVDVLKNLGYEKDSVIEKVKVQGLLDEATAAYIEKSFA